MPQLMCIWMTKTQVADSIERLNPLGESTRDFFYSQRVIFSVRKQVAKGWLPRRRKLTPRFRLCFIRPIREHPCDQCRLLVLQLVLADGRLPIAVLLITFRP